MTTSWNSSGIIDGTSDEPASRVTLECSEVADGVAMVESFSNVVALDTDDGLVLFDTSLARLRPQGADGPAGLVGRPGAHHRVHPRPRRPCRGAAAVVAEAAAAGRPAPDVVAHEAVPDRFARYRLTRGTTAGSTPGSSAAPD